LIFFLLDKYPEVTQMVILFLIFFDV